MPQIRSRHVVAALASAAALGTCTSGALAQSDNTFSYSLNPPAPNGEAGWYGGSPVTVTYSCSPAPGFLVESCPGPVEQIANAAAPVVRSARFVEFGNPANVVTDTRTLESSPGVPLRVDTTPPPVPSTRLPTQSRIFDAGSVWLADYSCDFTGDLSGPASSGSCTGVMAPEHGGAPIVLGQPIDTGQADVGYTWGRKGFQIIARDAAGNTRTLGGSPYYNVVELPGQAELVTPAAGAVAARRPEFTWRAPVDDGSGDLRYRLRIALSGQPVRTFDIRDAAATVSFTPPSDIPNGSGTWDVATIDRRGQQSLSAPRALTIATGPAPAAPRITVNPGSTREPRPLFAWEPAEPGGRFSWQVLNAAGQIVQGPVITDASTARVPQPLAAGTYAFRVRQITDLGGEGAVATAAFAVVATPSAPPPGRVTSTPMKPATRNARKLSPRAGARVGLRPTLTWPRVRRATLYNVQVFRLVGRRYVKVHTAFPRSNRYRVPAKRVRAGSRYVWRVWPYFGSTRRYSTAPLGVSYFDARRR